MLVELNVPKYVYMRLFGRKRKVSPYKDVIKEITRSKSTGATRVFIEDSPKGWWVAVKIFREGGFGKLYVLREVKYLDIPSKVMELSMERNWKPEYEEIIEEELRKWGLRNE